MTSFLICYEYMVYVKKDGSTFSVSYELAIDLSNYYTKAQSECQKYCITQNIDMGNSNELTNYPSPTDDNDLLRLNDLAQHLAISKTDIYLKIIQKPEHECRVLHWSTFQ